MPRILNTLKCILGLRNTITVNEILHGLSRLPIIRKYFHEKIYGITSFKVFATLLSVQGEIVGAFFGKLCFFVFILFASGAISSFNDYSHKTVFIYGFLVITLMGVFLFNAFKIDIETEYAVFLLGMDAKRYVTGRFLYKSLGVLVGYTLFGIPSALIAGVDWYIALLLPAAGIGVKVFTLGMQMLIYSAKQNGKKGAAASITGNANINALFLSIVFLAGLIAIPFIADHDPYPALAAAVVLSALILIPGILLIRRFPYGLYRKALFREKFQNEVVIEKRKIKTGKGVKEKIDDTQVESRAKGFRYLNELFIKRHTSIFTGRMIWMIMLTAVGIILLSVLLRYEIKLADDPRDSVVRYVISRHPGVFVLGLYIINTGAHMSHAMFANCDSSLLMYSFYKAPKAMVKMFRLRCMSVISFNLIPAIMTAVFAVTALVLTGGEDYPLQYAATTLTPVISAVLFSVRHMAIYYIMQPYDNDFMIKSKLYIALFLGLFTVCTVIMFAGVSAAVLSIAGAAVTVLYTLVADILVYRVGPKTFRR